MCIFFSKRISSSIFSVFIGLGIPWMLLILGNHGRDYDGIHDDGLVFAVMILMLFTFLFIFLVVLNKFVLKKWMAYIFVFIYIAYIVYGITYKFWLKV